MRLPCGLCSSLVALRLLRMRRWLFGAAEEAEDDAGGRPVIRLMSVGAERSAVVVEVEKADLPATGSAVIDAAADFVGDAILRSGAAAGGDVSAGAADEGFGEGSDVQAA